MSDSRNHEKYCSGNKFFILHEFNHELRDGLVIKLTEKIEELSKQKDARIDIYINSRGGDGALTMHLVQLIELAKANGIMVRTIVTDRAYSAGSMVAVAGTKGERYIARTAEHCAHYGSHEGWTERTPLQTERNANRKKRWFASLLAHYKKYCNIPKLEEAIKDDSYFITAQQAIKWGMADKYMEKIK